MSADEKRTSMVDRVRAMFAKAAATDFPEEAEAFEAKALEIMAHYEIEERELRDAGPHDSTLYSVSSFGNARYGAAALIIWTHELFGSYGVTFGPNYAKVTGTASAKEQADLFVDHLLPQLRADITRDKPRSRKSYSTAWSRRVTTRLKEAQIEAYETSMALVPTNAEAQRAYEEENGKASAGRRSDMNVFDYAQGSSAGDSADLRQNKVSA